MAFVFVQPARDEISRAGAGCLRLRFFLSENPQMNRKTVQPTDDDALDFRVYGRLAYVICKRRLELQVLQSQAGYYIGTLDEGLPCSRESVEYFPTETEALKALGEDKWTQKETP